ncbi:hypothetical protein [Chamaesiphon polymorphus]|uniref:Uncharacterized protein n=1 Tax=Chamaesiphon polymorphus CCALA 037 TaxID=2107692 RepID=A0A2T1FI45_9CYAN|nr:hypothetical protein [Chamaesiphon polymorphus]PSB44621.1 hypothetical protein C7B77_25575 [Chamaesiphon polymorphus CCALA 037]
MSNDPESKIKNWRINYRDRKEYYESQQAALDAVDLIISSCESGIWDENSHLYLSYDSAGRTLRERGETVDRDLLNSHYSNNVLFPTSFDDMFRIDLVAKNKEDWIFKYGSELLQQSILAGYECNDGYLAERVSRDYPGFKVNDRKYKKVDTPTESCLYACLGYEHAYCSSNNNNYYITIDNFLGKYQLIKPINTFAEITKLDDIGGAVVNNLLGSTEIRRYQSANFVPMMILISSLFTILMILLYAARLGLLL